MQEERLVTKLYLHFRHLIYLRLKTDSSVHDTHDDYVFALSCEWEICGQPPSLQRKLLSHLTIAPVSLSETICLAFVPCREESQ